MEDQLKDFTKKLEDLEKQVTDLRIMVANRDGAAKATTWWALGTGALIAAWLGASSHWQIPAAVAAQFQKEAGGKAEVRAVQAANTAEANLEKSKTALTNIQANEQKSGKTEQRLLAIESTYSPYQIIEVHRLRSPDASHTDTIAWDRDDIANLLNHGYTESSTVAYGLKRK